MTVCRMIQPETLEEALEALAGERAMACAGATNLYVDRRPVSYTHLDVYKRQGRRSSAR